jgi:hexosaminidase
MSFLIMTPSILLWWAFALSMARFSVCDVLLAPSRRIFPSAQIELYTEESTVLGIIQPDDVQIVTIGPMDVTEVVDAAEERFRKSLSRLPDFMEDYQENPSKLRTHEIHRIEIHVLSPDTKLFHGVDESYGIALEKDSFTIIVRCETVFGAVRGMETLAQLLDFGWLSKEGKTVFIIHSIPLFIRDSPSFAYRGLMIDTSRHYLPIELIKMNLDAMAMNKLNVLHWHLTDSQSFPYRSESYPELADKGAWHPRRVYNTSDIELVVKEAYLRGIRVIPEIDMPGHTRSIGKSHPELMSNCPDPSEPLDPSNPDVYDFVRTIYQDLKDIFPDEFVHVGGDEVPLDCWENSPNIKQWMDDQNITDTVDAYEYFETRLLSIVSDDLGKSPIVWQEVFNLNLSLSENAIVDVWKGFDRKTVELATAASFRVILSGCWYLDHLNDNWKTFYECDPRDFNGTVDLMIGGHASMWGEMVDASNFITRVWPRASAVAERLWTGDVSGEVENTVDKRIHRFRCHMVQQGFAAGPTGPGVCPHEVPYRHCSSRQEDTRFVDLDESDGSALYL